MDASIEDILGKLKVSVQDIRGKCVVLTVPVDLKDQIPIEDLSFIGNGLRQAGAAYTVLLYEPLTVTTFTRKQLKTMWKGMK